MIYADESTTLATLAAVDAGCHTDEAIAAHLGVGASVSALLSALISRDLLCSRVIDAQWGYQLTTKGTALMGPMDPHPYPTTTI